MYQQFPERTMLGEEAEIIAMASLVDQEKILARRLLVNVAYHSSHIGSTASEYERSIQRLELGHCASDSITMISSVTGQRISYNELSAAQFWVRNMVSLVRFSDAITQLCAHSAQKSRKKLDLSHKAHLQVDMLLEIGSHIALQGPVHEILGTVLGAAKVSYILSLVKPQSSLQSPISVVGYLLCLGSELTSILSTATKAKGVNPD